MRERLYCRTLLGILRVDIEEDVVVGISFEDACEPSGFACGCSVCDEIKAYIAGSLTAFSFRWAMNGTAFQCKVWEELCKIPYGETRSYRDIANSIGMPGASRAVGNACNRNPLLFVIPCHRVVGASGKIAGFAAGVERKAFLLEMERKGSDIIKK
jgi:O-6-methylguanine DNA methyltransferase